MNLTETVFGELACRVVDDLPDGRKPELAVILCHGFGAPGDDLVPLSAELLRQKPGLNERVRFFFPSAPLSLDAMGLVGGRAWWRLDMMELQRAVETGEVRDLRSKLPEGMVEARERLTAVVREVEASCNLSTSHVVLGGFSQGAMIATDVALRLADPPAALCIWSGTLVNEAEWRDLAANRGGLRVVQSHGRQDPLLPFFVAEALRDMLADAGANVEFLPFDGQHTIPLEGLSRLAAVLDDAPAGM